MGNENQPLAGPNLKNGIPTKLVGADNKLLGHADGEPVLLIRRNNQYFAMKALCSHYGANLNDGLIIDDIIHCPWHHACFNFKTGQATKAPALTALTTWTTEVSGDTIYVREKQTPKPCDTSKPSPEHFVIIGSGAAGHAAAERLREEGFTGALTMYTQDKDLPYDRPNLSKDYLAGNASPEWIPLRDQDFYTSKNIKIILNTRVKDLNVNEKTISLEGGETVKFDKCLIATGGTPFRPKIPGVHLPHVYVLRSFADCQSIIAALEPSKKVVIIGAGFIGLEAAASLKTRNLDVAVVAPNTLPLEKIVGPDVGSLLKTLHEKNGVKLRLNESVVEIRDKDVVLGNGETLEAAVVLMATGVKPNLDLAKSAGLTCENGVVVDEFLATSSPSVYAAGDMASVVNPIFAGHMRIEHWATAQRQGQSAALNMLDKKIPHFDIPFFWSQQFDLVLCYVGHATAWTKTEVYGDVGAKSCAVAYYNDDLITAVLTIGQDIVSLKVEHAFEKKDQSKIKAILKNANFILG